MPTKENKFNLGMSLGLFVCWICFWGCATAPAPISTHSGDSDLARLLESIRVQERLPALAAAIIIDGKIYATAAVGTRKKGTHNWVTVDDRFLIASCSKAFTATLSAALIEKGDLDWNTTLKEAFPEINMRSEYENITLIQLKKVPFWLSPMFVLHTDTFSKR